MKRELKVWWGGLERPIGLFVKHWRRVCATVKEGAGLVTPFGGKAGELLAVARGAAWEVIAVGGNGDAFGGGVGRLVKVGGWHKKARSCYYTRSGLWWGYPRLKMWESR